MDELTRMSVERRAYELWEAAGRPEGTGLAHWLQAELELGVIPAVEPSDPFKTLPKFARAIADETIRPAAHSHPAQVANLKSCSPRPGAISAAQCGSRSLHG